MQNKQTPLPENTNPKKGKAETISELAHRHLRDEKHTTTDEELRNATVELSDDVHTQDESLYEVDNTTVIPSSKDELSTNNNVKSSDRDNDSVPNPYSVLSK
ncbi:MAG: hypothetical protein H0U39_12415 [Segetibacter sp.]|nr:hypothetical protein [Segetibacter sp.]